MRAIPGFLKQPAQRGTNTATRFVLTCALVLTALVAPRVAADPDRLLDRLEREKRPGFVFDFAGVIPAQQRRAIESLLLEIEQLTRAQVKVVTLPSLEGGEIEGFANRLYERWGIGRRDRDDGVLILAAMEERRVRIEVGYGLEGVIPDARAGRILDEFVLPRMRADQPGEALAAGAAAVADAIARDAGVTLRGGTGLPRGPPSARRGTHPLLALLVVIGMIYMAIRHPFLFLLFLGGMRGGRGFGGGGFGGGGFGGGGFGGGMSGGGGASRGW